MKINEDDPRITAFALGELKGNDAIEIARAVQSDERIREAVSEVRDTSFLLLDSLRGGETPMLTSAQRDNIRRAGAGPVMLDKASVSIFVWKKPLLAGVGVAAAISLALYMVGGGPVIQEVAHTADVDTEVKSGWDWSQVDLQDLTAPAALGMNENAPENRILESAHAVASAGRDDTESYRKEVEQRIRQSKLKQASLLQEGQENDWVEVDAALRLDVPMASGAASWPWLQRYVDEDEALPPKQSVRIEELVNHFQYKTPVMLTGNALVADIEICKTPWNPKTSLLAVHIAARPNVNADLEKPTMTFHWERVRRVRLLGYAHGKERSPIHPAVVDARHIAKSQGNYVLYELELNDVLGSDESMAVLTLDTDVQLVKNRVKSWKDVSSDMRFASMVAATGMMLAEHPALGDFDADSLQGVVQAIEKQDGVTLTAERREALDLIQRVISISQESSEEVKVE